MRFFDGFMSDLCEVTVQEGAAPRVLLEQSEHFVDELLIVAAGGLQKGAVLGARQLCRFVEQLLHASPFRFVHIQILLASRRIRTLWVATQFISQPRLCHPPFAKDGRFRYAKLPCDLADLRTSKEAAFHDHRLSGRHLCKLFERSVERKQTPS